MRVLKSIAAAFSMFSRIPMPKPDWERGGLDYMLCAFPLIGLLIGLLLWGWGWLSVRLALGNFLYAAGLTLLPLLVTGGIHLDGFCDTLDALASHGTPERRREILKDSHAGAFAIIGACAYFAAYLALCSELSAGFETALALGLMAVFSRAASGLAATYFPVNGETGLLACFKSGAVGAAGGILIAETALTAALLCWLCFPGGIAMAAVAALCWVWLAFMSRRKFGGMSGDLAGWFLQVAELTMLAALVFSQKVAAIL